jgi:hypothetical protein
MMNPFKPRANEVALSVTTTLPPEIEQAIERDFPAAAIENTDNNEALAGVLDTNRADEPVTIVDRYDQIFAQSLERLRAAEADLVKVIDHKSEELRQTRLAVAAAEAARNRLYDEKALTSFEINEIQFLMHLDTKRTICVGLDREKLAWAKSLRDRGLVTIEDSANGPLVSLTPAGVYAQNMRPIGRLASAIPAEQQTEVEAESTQEQVEAKVAARAPRTRKPAKGVA